MQKVRLLNAMKKVILFILLTVLSISFSTGSTIGNNTMKLLSNAFETGGLIPPIYTCDGQNISPPLNWENAPANTKSFVLIMDDPDAPVGTWDHWLLFNIPSTVNSLA